MNKVKFDLIIVGGGVAGLWTLNRAVKAGFNAILLEQNTLGGGQTVRSQGIIHGGTKYALNGVLTQASNTIKEMPQRWRDCLAGKGELDLSKVKLLSDAHYMWSKGSLGSRMTTFFATKAFRGRVEEVASADRPQTFQHTDFKGNLYRLNELVLDVPSLIDTLRAPVEERIYKVDLNSAKPNKSGDRVEAISLPQYELQLEMDSLVLTSGEGYGQLASHLGLAQPQMQLRPLQMVMVKHPDLTPTFAHCIGTGSKPVATITTHPHSDGDNVWYLGGDVAETGVERDENSQIKFAQQTLSKLLPWINLQGAQWACLRVNRAEPQQSNLVRPDSAFAQQIGNCIVAWPTKLALSPDLADQVIPLCGKPSASATGSSSDLNLLPKPETAKPAWEELL